jgi:hypothetical protein
MMRSVVIYGSSIAVAAFLLRWLEYRHAVRMFSTELYVGSKSIMPGHYLQPFRHRKAR